MDRFLRMTLIKSGAAIILASSLLCVNLQTQASAADLLPPAPPLQAPVPVYGQAPDTSGWYLRGDVGAGYANNPKLDISPLPNGMGGTYSNPRRSGEMFVDAGVGYQFNNFLRGDVTAEYHGGGDVTSMTVFGYSGRPAVPLYYQSHLSSAVLMANGYIDVFNFNGITPFIGAGVGVARNTLYGGTLTSSYFSDGSKNSLAWALMAGLGYQVTQNLKLELGYRYLNLGSAKSGVEYCCSGASLSDYANVKNLTTHEFRVGMRWMLGDMPQPQQYVPVIQPQMAERPLVRRY